jgi:hypothetical protein
MTDLTDFAESLAIRWLLTDQTATRPTTWTVGLYTTAPNDAGGGVEVAGSGYARQAVTFTEASGIASTDADLTFTSSGSWGVIVAVGVFDGSGNLLLYKALSDTLSVTVSGQEVIVDAGSMTARLA